MIRAIKNSIYSLKNNLPILPNFGDLKNILKIIFVIFFAILITSFMKLDKTTDFLMVFADSLQKTFPYLSVQLLFLVMLSDVFNKIGQLRGIVLVFISNFLSIFFTYAIFHHDLFAFFYNLENSLVIYFISLGAVFLFLIFFDSQERNVAPANVLAKLYFLQSKMRPHFLFNTINTVVALLKEQPELAQKMLINLSVLLRVSLNEESMMELSSIDDELKITEKYLEIEKIRLGDRLSVEYNVDQDILSDRMPKLILQPLVENAVLHGIQTLENGGVISVKIIKILDKSVVIEVKNEFDRGSKTLSHGNNITIKNLEERLFLYYAGKASVNIINKNEVFIITLILPIKEMVLR